MSGEVDRDVLDRFVRGEAEAFESLFRRFERDVYSWILRIVRDPPAAEDVLVETFWRAYRGRARFDPSRPFGAWLRRIATNASLDELRRARRAAGWRRGDATPTAPSAPASEGLRASIRTAFRTLPPRLQMVAVLVLIEERTHAEVADALDLPIGTVKSRVFRAIRALRKELSRQGVRV
jgi:RNA polymerase sigma-70 factor (ECF subfamily)